MFHKLFFIHVVLTLYQLFPDVITSSTFSSLASYRSPKLPFRPDVRASCRRGLMLIRVFTPHHAFNGMVHARDKRHLSHCSAVGEKSNVTLLRIKVSTEGINSTTRSEESDDEISDDNTNCGLYIHENGEYSIAIVVRLHPTFQTVFDKSYIVTCGQSKPLSSKRESDHVSLMLVGEEEDDEGEDVTTKHNGIVVYGQPYTFRLQGHWTIEDNIGMRVRGCFAFSDTNNSVELWDHFGCPETRFTSCFSYNQMRGRSEARVHSMFKFTNSHRVHFQCFIELCSGLCGGSRRRRRRKSFSNPSPTSDRRTNEFCEMPTHFTHTTAAGEIGFNRDNRRIDVINSDESADTHSTVDPDDKCSNAHHGTAVTPAGESKQHRPFDIASSSSWMDPLMMGQDIPEDWIIVSASVMVVEPGYTVSSSEYNEKIASSIMESYGISINNSKESLNSGMVNVTLLKSSQNALKHKSEEADTMTSLALAFGIAFIVLLSVTIFVLAIYLCTCISTSRARHRRLKVDAWRQIENAKMKNRGKMSRPDKRCGGATLASRTCVSGPSSIGGSAATTLENSFNSNNQKQHHPSTTSHKSDLMWSNIADVYNHKETRLMTSKPRW